MKINFVAFPLEKNLKAQAELIEKYGNYSPEEADFTLLLDLILEELVPLKTKITLSETRLG